MYTRMPYPATPNLTLSLLAGSGACETWVRKASNSSQTKLAGRDEQVSAQSEVYQRFMYVMSFMCACVRVGGP